MMRRASRLSPFLLALLLAATIPSRGTAECLGADPVGASVDYGGGSKVSVLAKTDETLRYRFTDGAGNSGVTQSVHGLFLVETAFNDGPVSHFTWESDLVPATAFPVGVEREWKAVRSVEGKEPKTHILAFTNLGPETVTFGGCSYETIKLRMRVGPADAPETVGTRWFDPVTLLTYRTDLNHLAPDGTVRRRQTSMARALR